MTEAGATQICVRVVNVCKKPVVSAVPHCCEEKSLGL